MDRYIGSFRWFAHHREWKWPRSISEIVIPWSVRRKRFAFGEKYENAHKNVLEIGREFPRMVRRKAKPYGGRLGVLWDVQERQVVTLE